MASWTLAATEAPPTITIHRPSRVAQVLLSPCLRLEPKNFPNGFTQLSHCCPEHRPQVLMQPLHTLPQQSEHSSSPPLGLPQRKQRRSPGGAYSTCATRNCRGRAATRPPLGLISASPATPRSSDSASRQATPRCNLGMEGRPTPFAAPSARLFVLAPAAGRDGIGACSSHPRATPAHTARCARELASVAPEPQVLLLRAPSVPPRPSNFAAGPSSLPPWEAGMGAPSRPPGPTFCSAPRPPSVLGSRARCR